MPTNIVHTDTHVEKFAIITSGNLIHTLIEKGKKHIKIYFLADFL